MFNHKNKNRELKIALCVLVAGIMVFIFAMGCFIGVRVSNSGQSDGMPLAQIKQNGEWVLLRAQPWSNVDPNVVSYDYFENEYTGEYDLIIHYREVQ